MSVQCKIYKYELAGRQTRIDLPPGSEWLSVAFQPPMQMGAKLYAWARIPDPAPKGYCEWCLFVEDTGAIHMMAADAKFLGTVQRADGEVVHHVFAWAG